MKNNDEDSLFYKTTLSPDIAQAYAKRGCNKCYGRGLLNYISPQGNEHSAYCSCVEKKLKRQKL